MFCDAEFRIHIIVVSFRDMLRESCIPRVCASGLILCFFTLVLDQDDAWKSKGSSTDPDIP